MLSNKSTNSSSEPQASPLRDNKAGAAAVAGVVLDPRCEIEVAAGGTGTINDPSGADGRPPGACDLDVSLFT